MKSFFIILVISFSLNGHGQNPFSNLQFDKVVMYEFDGGKGGDMSVIDKDGKMAQTISKEVVLDKKDIDVLNKKLGSTKSYGGGEAACYEPRLGFVYYLKNIVVAKVDVCLSCNRLRSNIEIKAQKQGKNISEKGEIFYLGEGLSDSFKKYLYKLIKSKGFKYID
jgi:hypothetical protein